jgi:hypothetical protein
MVTPLLETKFYVPKWRRGLVPRPRLSDRLNRGAESKLTLVSAPAGFGKTTLLADWLAAVAVDGRTVTWLSLDQSDNHPASFWTYLIAALQTAEPHIGASAISLLQSPQPLGRVVGRLPLRVPEERAQSCEMVGIQVLLLATERREGGSRRVVMPGLIPRLGVSRAPPLSVIVLPDGEPCFQEGTGYFERHANRTGQQPGERLLFLCG